jgi:mannose-6-phosphate isomerase-like protein (cupin superfamily)
MNYTLTKDKDLVKKNIFGINLREYPNIDTCGVVVTDTETGHNQEFYHKKSTFHYIVLEGSGTFVLDDNEVPVEKGDMISIQPGTRIYYKGAMKLVLITNPAWTADDEVETKPQAWGN